MTKLPLVTPQKCAEEDDGDEWFDIEPFTGKIWLANTPKPDDVQGVMVTLNGREDADLDWSAQLTHAGELVRNGCKILWNIDLGLFQNVKKPLTDERQLAILKLSLQHFRETVWENFQSETIGLVIYNGDVMFSCLSGQIVEETLPFQEWLREHQAGGIEPSIASAYYRRDVAAEYMTYLIAALPEELRIFLHLSTPSHLPLSVVVGLLNPDRFDKIEWILDSEHPLHAAWQRKGELLIPQQNKSPTGFCIPYPEWMPESCGILDEMLSSHRELRLIPEGSITSRWDCLDRLYVIEELLTPFGKRQLQGFIAAGGTVLSIP